MDIIFRDINSIDVRQLEAVYNIVNCKGYDPEELDFLLGGLFDVMDQVTISQVLYVTNHHQVKKVLETLKEK